MTVLNQVDDAQLRYDRAKAELVQARRLLKSAKELPSREQLSVILTAVADGRLKKLGPKSYSAPSVFFRLCITPTLIVAAEDAGLLTFE